MNLRYALHQELIGYLRIGQVLTMMKHDYAGHEPQSDLA